MINKKANIKIKTRSEGKRNDQNHANSETKVGIIHPIIVNKFSVLKEMIDNLCTR